MKRSEARKVVDSLLGRVEVVQTSDEHLFRVVHVKVSGSYLTDAADVDRIHLHVRLAPKFIEPTQTALREAKIKAAIAAGRRFDNYTLRCAWPWLAVMRFLHHRSRILDLKEDAERVPIETPWQYLYQSPQ